MKKLLLVLGALIVIIFVFPDHFGIEKHPPAATTSPSSTIKSDPPPSAAAAKAKPPSRFVDHDLILKAKQAVRAQLRDSGSADFRDVEYGDSEETGPVAYGYVNSNNGFGGKAGFQKFVSNGSTTLLEERDARLKEAWLHLSWAKITEQSIASFPELPAVVAPARIKIREILNRSEDDVSKILDAPSSREKIREGERLTYASKNVEIVYNQGRSILITVNELSDVQFSPMALDYLGLPRQNPTFANKNVIRWNNFPGIKAVSLFPAPSGSDYAYIEAE